MSRRLILATIAVVLLLAGIALLLTSRGHIPSAFSGTKLRRANVLIVTLDTTRADRIGAYGYRNAETPVFDRLASEGVLFEECITPTAYTLPSHSSIMTGLYPPQHGVRLNGEGALSDANETLAERLSASGYRTGAFVGAFVLDGRWGLKQGFEHYDDQFHIGADQRLDLAGVQRPASSVVDAALKWLDQDSSRPFFAWLHFYDAHTPYAPPEPFKGRFASKGPTGMYDGEIAFADSQLGRLVDWLERSGRKEDTIVVVVGDHGEGLGSHGEDEHGYYLYDYAVRVPFVMRVPARRLAGRRVAAQVRTIDITPTLYDLLDLEPAKNSMGKPLTPLMGGTAEEAKRYAYSESMAVNLQYGWAALYSLRTSDYKYVHAPRAELYALKSDPNEATNRFDDERRAVRELRTELQRVRDAAAKSAPAQTQQANLDQETLKMLASLGYLGGGSTQVRDDEGLADPKDKIHLFESVGFAAHVMGQNNYKEAAEVLEIVLKDDPNVPQAQFLLSTVYRKLNQPAKAHAILDAYLKRDPNDMRALIAMAELLNDEGRHQELMAICKQVLSIDDNNPRAYELMADVHMVNNDHARALPLLQKVVEIQPKLTRSRNNMAAALIGVGRTDEAEKVLADVTREYPKFPLAHYHLGLLRERQGRTREAMSEYATEVKNHPKAVPARFNLGNLLLRAGDAAGAEEQIRAAIEHEPTAARPYLLLGQMLLSRSSDLGEVERLAQQGLQRATEPELKAFGYFLLADVYSRQGRRAELQDAVQKGNHYRSLIRS